MSFNPLQGWYLFCLGLAAGFAFLALTVYAALSPRWLKWLVIAAGVFTLSRYITMVLCALSDNPSTWWSVRYCWFGTSIGLTFPSVVAMDQLIRHPAMSPKKLLQCLSPLLVGYAIVMFFGRYEAEPDRVLGLHPHLIGWAAPVLGLLHSCFVVGFLALGALLIRKLPVRRIQIALAGLMAAQVYLALDGVLESLHIWYFRPYLFSEMLALAAIWWALHTARSSSV